MNDSKTKKRSKIIISETHLVIYVIFIIQICKYVLCLKKTKPKQDVSYGKILYALNDVHIIYIYINTYICILIRLMGY